MADNWSTMSAAALGRGIGAGEIDPVALAESFLAAIDAHPHGGEIYVRTTRDRALAEAAAAGDRARAGRRRGPLDGVPVSWKDLFDTAGVATEAGSALLAGRVPEKDAQVLRNATAAGLVCLGKTHLSELAFSGLGYNPVTATPPCINDPEAVPGGSSSGAAASVAFGLAPAAIGSDTGGSVRIPAVWNDLVGLKTTSGLLPLDGVVPLGPRFDTVGPLCRKVEDAALLLGALAGSRSPDLVGASLKGARFAILKTLAFDGIADAPRAGFMSATERLANSGAQVSEIELPEVAEANEMSALLLATEAYATWKDVIESHPDKMFHEIRERFRAGGTFSGTDYVEGWQRLDRLRAVYLDKTAAFDAIILPTSPILPPNRTRLASDSEYYRTTNMASLRNTRIGNLFGLAGLTLPTGVPSVGIMFLSAPFSEPRLLRIGQAAEAALA